MWNMRSRCNAGSKRKLGDDYIRSMRLIFILLSILFALSISAQRYVTTLRTGWKFAKGQHDQAYRIDYDDAGWKDVILPHDWGVDDGFIADGDGSTGKLPWKGEGWYRKIMTIPSADKGKELYLLCDGIMAFPQVYVNGKLAGKWDYGYNSFYLDITGLIKYGAPNVLAIHADTRHHDSRWYPGAGIYRKIQLITVNPVHVDIWGTSVTTPMIKPNSADVRVATTVGAAVPQGDTEAVRIIQSILTQDHNVIAQKEMTTNILGGSHQMTEVTLTIQNPHKWDTEHPYLYTLKTELFRNDILIDSVISTFGVRSMRFTADHGFYLNDKRVQFKGVCLHHDLGPLGTAFNQSAMERELRVLKDMGCNAVRTSHNVAAPELLDLCDRMGILVFDEIFDKYDGKVDITDTTDFEAFAQRNVRNWITRDRNHPCVFIWSVGNEIGDVQWNNNNGFWKLRTMVNDVRKYDVTRPVTLVCDSYESAALRHFDYYDVHSWNYGRRYAFARQLDPTKAVIISESASTVSTRGFYEFPLPKEKTDFTASLQVSSYDLNAPWWAEVPDDDMMWQQEEPYIAGEFVWSGFDYLGEPTPYDNRWAADHDLPAEAASRSSYFGIADLCGIPKDRYYLYKSYWKPEATTIHILPHWNWPGMEGKNIPVFVYTNGDCAELFLNGKSLGMQCKDPNAHVSTERFRLRWDSVAYEPGELRAVAYAEGEKIGEQVMRTAGPPAQLRLTPDRTTIAADGNDLSYVLIEALDKDGNPCPLANNTIEIHLSGNGTIAGVGNGNPQSLNAFKSESVPLFYGKAMAIIRSGSQAGVIGIAATADGLIPAQSAVTTQ